MDIREVFARNLRVYRRQRGLSQEELAERAGIDRTYISALERCVYGVSIDVLDRLARALELEAADLLQRSRPSKGEDMPTVLDNLSVNGSGAGQSPADTGCGVDTDLRLDKI